jgi:hypothetical protein
VEWGRLLAPNQFSGTLNPGFPNVFYLTDRISEGPRSRSDSDSTDRDLVWLQTILSFGSTAAMLFQQPLLHPWTSLAGERMEHIAPRPAFITSPVPPKTASCGLHQLAFPPHRGLPLGSLVQQTERLDTGGHMANPSVPPHKQLQPEFGMSIGAVLISLLLLCQIAMAAGTVGFNVKWYSP